MKWKPYAAGIAFCVLAASAAFAVAGLPWNKHLQLSALTLAILAGMLFAHSGFESSFGQWQAGIRFSQQRLLRWGIVLYGLRLTLSDLSSLGPAPLLIDAAVICTILLGGYFLGTKVFRLDPDTALLISAGSGICGAAAVLATDRVIESESHKVSVAVATVVLFGTAAMFLYPALYPITGFSVRQFGVFAGSTIHEVAQVVAAGQAVGSQVADIAVPTKMARVLLLAPSLLLIGLLRRKSDGVAAPGKFSIPWFALGFAGVIIVHSLVAIPSKLNALLLNLDTLLLASAMFALGLGTRWKDFARVGPRPLLFGAVLMVVLLAGGSVLARTLIHS